MVYIECKSGKPGNIAENHIREFLQRTVELAPDLAIFLIDTFDDLDPIVDQKMNPILREVLSIDTPDRVIHPVEDYAGIRFGFRNIYLTGSRTSIIAQLRRCLQHFYAHVGGIPRNDLGAINFIGRPLPGNS
jgi:hypothetical protein